MKDKIKNPNKMISELFKKRRESNEELSEKYKKLCVCIKPFLQQNPEKLELMRYLEENGSQTLDDCKIRVQRGL